MMPDTMLSAAVGRRELMRLAALAGMGAAFAPRLALAAGDPDPMPRVRALIGRWVGPGKFPGLVATLGVPGRALHVVALGSEGFTDLDPMTPDSLFRIYSMTKPVTGMATMLLIGEGKLKLDQPLAEILPKFARMQVQVTPDGSITDLRPAKTAITIRHLLTHTAGLPYSIVQKGPIKQAMEDAGLISGRISRIPVPGLDRGTPIPGLGPGTPASGLEAFADGVAAMPLVYEPGTKWSYGTGLDLLGRVIEVVSGQTFDAFLRDHIFAPCDMDSTWFTVPAQQAGRLTTNYAVANGIFVPIDKGEESVYLDTPPFPMGGSGLVSSPRDYDKFLQMLANRGVFAGRRVIAEAAVAAGVGNLLPPGVDGPDIFGGPSDFGAGGRVGRGVDAGIFGWAGAAGTMAVVDVRRGIRSQMFAQFMPPDSNGMLNEFQDAVRGDVMALPATAK